MTQKVQFYDGIIFMSTVKTNIGMGMMKVTR